MKGPLRVRAGLSALVVSALAVSSCGSSDSSTSSESSAFHSRVDESKALGALTPAEAKTLCEDVASWTATLTKDPAYVSGFCNFSAISAASLAASSQQLTVDQMRSACQTDEAKCLSDLGMTMPMQSTRGCAYAATCTATVADLKNCTVGTYQGNLKLYATMPSCDAMQPDTVSKIDYSVTMGAASVCAKVTACGLPT